MEVVRRAGDIAACFADPHKAKNSLGWYAKLSLQDMMADTWRWQQANPNGYESQD
ncbi:hypothetical protein [Psychrobacter sp. 78a-MNA-CIBAN-0178]|uniref:hypothetical protein n=1 Tax=Psychrobacter sp. 78a-MNA-CIBAN-0178 TaxID=3140450 RepID=UPI00331F23CB